MPLQKVILSCFVAALCFAAAPDEFDSYSLTTLMVPMRDGVRLATDVYLPARNGRPERGGFPVLVTRSPYNKAGEQSKASFFARQGYAFVAQDTRGFFASQGRPTPLINEGEDGYDTIEWVAAQPWTNGRVATTGASYLAMNQLTAAMERPPHLEAMYVAVSTANFFADSAYPGGVPGFSWPIWLLSSTGRRDLSQKPEPWLALSREKRAEVFEKYPEQKQAYWDFYSHKEFDAYWKQKGFWPAGYYKEMKDVPMLFVSGWYDAGVDSNLEHFSELPRFQESMKKVIIGPWPHDYGKAECGDGVFPGAELDERSIQLDWFDHWLKGKPLRADDPAPIRYYCMTGMRGGEWRTAASWPPSGARPVRLYLHSGGTLDFAPPQSEAPSTYVHDPANLVPTAGGRFKTCIVDQRAIEMRPDVLSFTGAPLAKSLEVTGRVRSGLWVSSEAEEMDFMARLVDAHPDGYAMIVAEGQIRVHRVGEAEIDLGSVSNVFQEGHRVRLDVMSSNYPKLEPIAVRSPNTVYHDVKRTSWLDLPVVP